MPLLPSPAPPPAPEKRTRETVVHGVALRDDFAWLKADNWQEVLRDTAVLPADIRAFLEAENAHAEALSRPSRRFRTSSSPRCAAA